MAHVGQKSRFGFIRFFSVVKSDSEIFRHARESLTLLRNLMHKAYGDVDDRSSCEDRDNRRGQYQIEIKYDQANKAQNPNERDRYDDRTGRQDDGDSDATHTTQKMIDEIAERAATARGAQNTTNSLFKGSFHRLR